jgi:predicted acyl esterase
MVNVDFENWPVPSTKFETLYLAANGLLSKDAPTQAEFLSYQSDVKSLQMDSYEEELCFEYIFPRKSCILGCA